MTFLLKPQLRFTRKWIRRQALEKQQLSGCLSWPFNLFSFSHSCFVETLTVASQPLTGMSLFQSQLARREPPLPMASTLLTRTSVFLSFFFFLKRDDPFIYSFIYLFMAVLGLRFCVRAFSSCSKRGPLFITVRGPLTIAASLVAEHRLQTHRLRSCGSRAQLLRGMWDLPRPGLEPVSPALAGRLSTTAPPGKPLFLFLSEY